MSIRKIDRVGLLLIVLFWSLAGVWTANALRKNVANQRVCAMVYLVAGGPHVGGSVQVFQHLDGTSAQTLDGVATSVGNGVYCYQPTQGATNGDFVGLLFHPTSTLALDSFVPMYTEVGADVMHTNGSTGNIAQTVNDKTGYGLAADQAVNVTKVNGTAQTGADLAGYLSAHLAGSVSGAVDGTKIDGSITSRAAASTALSNATWTDAKAAMLDGSVSSRAPSSTALSTATWTAGKAAMIDGSVSAIPTNPLLTTDSRLGNLDGSVSSVLGHLTGTLGAGTHAAQTGDAYVYLGAHLTGTVSAAAMAHLDADVSSRSTYAGGAVASVTGNVGGNVAGSVGSVTNDVGITQAGADKVWGSASRSLTTFGTLVADIASAVWSATTRTLSAFGFSVTAGTVSDKSGYSLATAPPTLAAIHDDSSALLNSYGVAKTSQLPAAAPTASQNAVATWDELLTGHNTGSSAAVYLKGASAPSASTVADAVWSADAATHNTGSTMGAKLNSAAAGGVDYGEMADAVKSTLDAAHGPGPWAK